MRLRVMCWTGMLLWSACDDGHPCNLADFVDGAGVQLKQADGVWEPGKYTFEFGFRRNYTCTLEVPGGLPQRRSNETGLSCEPHIWINFTDQTDCFATGDDAGSCESIWVLSLSELDTTPSRVSVRVTRDGETILDEEQRPKYKDTEPNGPGCGITKIAKLTFEIE